MRRIDPIMATEEEYVEQVLKAKRDEYIALFVSKKGKTILEMEKQHQGRLRKARNEALKKLPKAQRETQRLKNKFMMYDIDGSGTVDWEEFQMISKDLCLSISDEKLKEEFEKMDQDRNGSIDFEEFRAWYEESGKKLGGGFGKLFMKAAKRTKSMRGGIDLVRAKRSLLKQCLAKAKKEAIQKYREVHGITGTHRNDSIPEDDPDFAREMDDAEMKEGNMTEDLAKQLVDDYKSFDKTKFFYLNRKGLETGPVSGKRFLGFANEKMFVWYEGLDAWYEISELEDVYQWLRHSQWYVVDAAEKIRDGPLTKDEVKERKDFGGELFVWRRAMGDKWTKVKNLRPGTFD